MKKTSLLFSVLFLLAISINAQKNKQNNKKLPLSIYTFNHFENNNNSFYTLNKKLKLKTLYFKNNLKKPSEFVSDDLKRYIDKKLSESFLAENDPTQWNPCNFQGNVEQ